MVPASTGRGTDMAGSRRDGIVTGGTWCVDHNKLVGYWPQEDGLVEIVSEESSGGGPGFNLAVDIRKLDPTIAVETIGIVGNDEDGRLLFAECDAYGIDRRQLHVSSQGRTAYADAFGSLASGRRTHIFHMGANAFLTPDHFDFESTTGRILHLGMPGVHKTMDAPWHDDPNGWVTVLRKARAAGLVTNIELGSIDRDLLARLMHPCLPYLDLGVVNDVEIGALGGERTADEGNTDVEACIRAARKVIERGSMEIVVAHFPRGAVAVCRDGRVETHPSVRVPQSAVVAANGAGDAFAAGFVYGYHSGWPLTESLALAHATAAASLRHASTAGAIETWRNCLALAQNWGWNDPIA